HNFKVYGARVNDFFWMKGLRTIVIDQHGFVVHNMSVWMEPSRKRPVELGRRRTIDCNVRLKICDGPLLKLVREKLKRFSFARTVTTVIRIELVGSEIEIMVTADQAAQHP